MINIKQTYVQNAQLYTKYAVNAKTEENAEGSSNAGTTNNTDNTAYKTGCAYTMEILRNSGFTKAQIEQYFDRKGKGCTLNGEEFDVYSLKSNIVINGKEINNINDLIAILGINRDSNRSEKITLDNSQDLPIKGKPQYDRTNLWHFGFTDAQIEQYFDERGGARTLGGSEEKTYTLKTGIVINDQIITNINDLINILGINFESNKTGKTLGEWLKNNE